MVNLEKWEEIEWTDIRQGDMIKVVTIGKRGDFYAKTVAKGTVTGQTWGDDWSSNGINLAKKPGSKGKDFTDTFYRRKPKPFTFPTTPLSIIEGETRHTSGPPRRYFLTEDGGWKSARDGMTAHKDALLANFHNWKIIFEGVDLGNS